MKAYLSFLLVLLTATTFAQTKDCYPNSSVSFDVIERERIPSITSVEAIGTQCRVDADKKLAEYRNEDEKNFNFLKNKYFAALSGWVQTGDCEHGGPPPCCTAPAASVPWAVVGAEKAKAALMAEWHKVQNQRQYEVEKLMHDCLAGLKSAGINKFNDLYAQADDCLKGIQDIKVVADYNKGLIVGYVNQLNDIHAQMQVMAGKTTPDPTAVTLLSNSMEKLQIEICAKLSQLNNPVKNDPHTGTAMGVRAEVEKPKVESQAITNNSSPQVQQKAAYQQTANNYVNAANTTTGIEKVDNLNSALLNATMSGNKAQAAQIRQQQNQQTQQSINSTFDGLKNQVQQLYDQRAADRQESYERDMQKLKDEERQREENVDRRIKASNESNRQTAIDMDQILDYGNFNSNPPHSEKIPDNAKQSFYITYERDYASNRITLKTYTLNKYSDGTWMSEPDIQKKIDFTKYMSSSDRYTDLLGPYASTANAMMVINKIKTNAGGIAGSITTDDSFAPLNKPANPTANKDFWNN